MIQSGGIQFTVTDLIKNLQWLTVHRIMTPNRVGISHWLAALAWAHCSLGDAREGDNIWELTASVVFMKETTGKWETVINSGGICGYLLDKQFEKSTYNISLHMVHLLLYDLPSASRTGSLSRVQLSFPSFIFSRYSAHWSWKGKREQASWMTWSVVCLLSLLNNLSQKFLTIFSYTACNT